jgi:hypothetical protein
MWGSSSRTFERDGNEIGENAGGWPELETAGNKRLSVWCDDATLGMALLEIGQANPIRLKLCQLATHRQA